MIGRENHLVTATMVVEIPARATMPVTVALSEPASSHEVQLLELPLAKPIQVTVTGATCD